MKTDSITRFRMLALCLVTLATAASPAAAQTQASGKWEIEFHGGGLLPTNPTSGTVSLPGSGQVFATAPRFDATPSSRRQSSWYFGDGAVLFDQVASDLAARGLARFPERITTLDPVLGRSLGKWRRGGSIGARVSRLLTPRLSAELSVDYSLRRRQMTQANSDAIEATRASFVSAFNGMITHDPRPVLQSLTSTAAIEGGSGHQFFTSGTLIINLRTIGGIVPYATVGASVLSTTGQMPSATLKGNYQILLVNGAQINETDNVTVRDARDERTFAGILGGGLKYYVSSRWGIRLDARVSLSKNTASTVLDATPNVALGQLPAGRSIYSSNPTIQFSNNSSDPVTALGSTAVAASTLSGPALTGLATFSGRGVSRHTNITGGVFWRF
ncbi:MAG: hypothetical protein ABIS06_12165 [Vicinamibacterales bacterium]